MDIDRIHSHDYGFCNILLIVKKELQIPGLWFLKSEEFLNYDGSDRKKGNR